jgi:hypothetical protein
MQNTSRLFVYLALGVILIHSSCDSNIFKKGIEEGTIEYSITYPQIPEGNYLLDIMPNQMEMNFKNGVYRSDIIAGMGLFKTSIISNKEDDKLIHSVKLLNKKFASTLGSEDIIEVSPYYKEVRFEFTDKTKQIAGYECKEVIAHIEGDSSWNFSIFYTDEINIETPNRLTPFEPIEGVLMEYDLYNYNTHMHFEAHNVIEQKVDQSHIDLEDGYVMVSPTELKSEIESIFANIQ